MNFPKNKKRWVLWKREPVQKQGVPTGEFTKVPYMPSGRRASSTNEKTWSLYTEAQKIRHNFDGIGMVFDGSWLGVDLDHVLQSGKIIDSKSELFVKEANTLTEISPSGDGLHLYFKLSEPLELASNAYKPNPRIKYECYTSGRYFTVTENNFENRNTARIINADTAGKLLSVLGYPWLKKENSQNGNAKMGGNALSDEEILKILFKSKNGAKMREVYNGSDAHHNNDTSAADASLCAMLAFYTNKDAQAMERVWLSSPRGKRDKVQKRKDYRERTIRFAIETTKEVFKQNTENNEEYNYFVTQEGKKGEVTIPLITENIRYFLNTHKEFKGRFRFEEFKRVIEWKQYNEWRQIKDDDFVTIANSIARVHPYFAKVHKEMVADAVMSVSKQYSYDEVKNYITGIVWDKTPRLDTWLTRAFGVREDAYHRAVGANWMKGLVMRALEPGSKHDYVLVLEGEQGVKKSTALATLADPWHTETIVTPDNKDFFMQFHGNLVVEFSEGETLSRGEMKKLKAVITMTHDDIRLPYARLVTRIPRRCVFAMTTNEEQYLKDNTGNRRWLPVRVEEEINLAWIKENRDQLYAEAYHRLFVLKEKYWEFPEEETKQAQMQRMLSDPNEDEIIDWYMILPDEKRFEGITTKEAWESVRPLNSFGERKGPVMNKADEMAVGAILRNTLRLKRKLKKIRGVIRSVYIPTQNTPAPIEATPVETEIANF